VVRWFHRPIWHPGSRGICSDQTHFMCGKRVGTSPGSPRSAREPPKPFTLVPYRMPAPPRDGNGPPSHHWGPLTSRKIFVARRHSGGTRGGIGTGRFSEKVRAQMAPIRFLRKVSGQVLGRGGLFQFAVIDPGWQIGEKWSFPLVQGGKRLRNFRKKS